MGKQELNISIRIGKFPKISTNKLVRDRKKTNIAPKSTKLNCNPEDIIKYKQKYIDNRLHLDNLKTKYEKFFGTIYGLSTIDKKKFSKNLSKLFQKKEMKTFFIQFFKILTKALSYPGDTLAGINIKDKLLDYLYLQDETGTCTIGHSVDWSDDKFRWWRIAAESDGIVDYNHRYLTPNIFCPNGDLNLIPFRKDVEINGILYNNFMKKSSTKSWISTTFGGGGSKKVKITGFTFEGWQKNYDEKNVDSVDWTPELTHDNYYIKWRNNTDLYNKPWIYMRYALNEYATNLMNYKYGILMNVSVYSIADFLVLPRDSGREFLPAEKLGGEYSPNHANKLIVYIADKDADIKQINFYYHENNDEIIAYIKPALKKLLKLVALKFEADNPNFKLNINIIWLAPGEVPSLKVETVSLHGLWAVEHGICQQVAYFFGIMWGMLGSYFKNPGDLYRTLQGELFQAVTADYEKGNKGYSDPLILTFMDTLQRLMTLYHYVKRQEVITEYQCKNIAKWQVDADAERAERKEDERIVSGENVNDGENVNVEEKDNDEELSAPLSTSIPSIGGKKIRKHRGIIQTGGNVGRLKKGYRYSGKRLKNGTAEIIKVRKTKRV